MNRNIVITTLTLATLAGVASAQSGPSSWKVFLADQTHDGVVDAADYTIWRSSVGDFTRDGQVDASDYTVWRDNFGSTSATPGGSDQFDLASKGGPIDPVALGGWGSSMYQYSFPDSSAAGDDPHKEWIPILSIPATGVAGDYDEDGDVDGNDFILWRQSIVDFVTLDRFILIAGDFDADGDVDGRDFLVWQRNFGQFSGGVSVAAGDLNGDGLADAADYLVWRDGPASALAQQPSHLNDSWWTPAVACPADVNGDGVLDNGDITAFIQLFISGNLAADMNNDGFIDNGDISTFIAMFLAGC